MCAAGGSPRAPGGAFSRGEVIAMDEITKILALLVLVAKLTNEIACLIQQLRHADNEEGR